MSESRFAGVIALFLALICTAGTSLAAAPAPLRFAGNTSTFELAPVLLAADGALGGPVILANGGVPDLFKPGGAEIATNAETQALRVSVEHPDLRILMTVAEGHYRLVARRSAGIASVADLKGKRIATIAPTSSGYFLHRLLRTAGLTIDDVTVVPLLPLSKMPEALEKREVDAVTIWEPEIQLAAERIGDDAIEFSGRGIYRELFNLHATRQQLEDPAQRRRIVAFVRGVLEATRRLHADPRAAIALVSRSSGYDVPLVTRTFHHEGVPGALVPDLLDVMVEEDAWLARDGKRAPRSREALAQLIDASVLREALAGEGLAGAAPPR